MASFSAPAWALRSLSRPVAGCGPKFRAVIAKDSGSSGSATGSSPRRIVAPPKQAAETAVPVSSYFFRAPRFALRLLVF
jgi:hypothetical protein